MNRKPRTFEPPVEGATRMSAEHLAPGDLIVYQAGRTFDIDVEEVETDLIGHIRVRHGNGTASSSFHPSEALWVVRAHKREATNASR